MSYSQVIAGRQTQVINALTILATVFAAADGPHRLFRHLLPHSHSRRGTTLWQFILLVRTGPYGGVYQRRGLGPLPGMHANQHAVRAVVSPGGGQDARDAVTMPAGLCLRLLRRAGQIHRAGLKSYGLLIAEPDTAGYPFTATDVVFLDSGKNRRNDPAHRAAFRAQGEYFRQFDDAGFVADPAELLAVWRAIEDSGAQVVAPFHSHRRQPANFSLIDYRLHNPAFGWHLIISLRDPRRPVLQPFAVHKQLSDYGISDRDAGQDSQLAYPGPEVRPLALAAHGAHRAIRQLTTTLAAATGPARPRDRTVARPPTIPSPDAGRPSVAAIGDH